MTKGQRRLVEKPIRFAVLLWLPLALGVLLYGCGSSPERPVEDDDVLFQAATLDALLQGIYDGGITFAELKEHGDFGLGTFEALDGEMVAVDGEVYQVKTDGIAYPVDDTMESPFAVMTFFEPDTTLSVDTPMDCMQLEEHIDGTLPTKNIAYAIRVEGVFDHLKTRSVPRQAKPYPPLATVVENEVVFELQDVRGVMVGFRLPSYMQGVNVAGYHFHFLTHDRKAGGHVLECQPSNVTIGVDHINDWTTVLPDGQAFYEADFSD